MVFYNSLTAYVNANDLSKDVFECIMKKIGCEYSTIDVEGEEYYKFTCKRENKFSMNYGTFTKLDFSGVTIKDVDSIAVELIETVDKMENLEEKNKKIMASQNHPPIMKEIKLMVKPPKIEDKRIIDFRDFYRFRQF